MKNLTTLFAVLFAVSVFAQDGPYQFTTIKENGKGATEDQCASGTCWSFATISFLESEIIRKGNSPVDLSEMFNVRMEYPEKAESFVRYQGKQQFGPGGLAHDVINVVRDHGMVPESAYSGLLNGKTEHNHGSLDAALESWVKTVLDKKMHEQDNEWMVAVEGLIESYLGKAPNEFDWNGKKYTPSSFRDAMGINASDYVSLSSFTHHPFNSEFVLEVPDNWAKGSFYNLPLDEFQQVVDYAIDNGYTVAWDADVSEKGFSFKHGLGIIPSETASKDDVFKKTVAELSATQDARQKEFDSQKTTDDHLMHITGKAKDQDGNMYYIVKNSWGSGNVYKGYQYVSVSYLRMKTVSILLHKDAIPKETRKKLGV